MPGAFLGGWIHLPAIWFQRLLGLVLLSAAWRLSRVSQDPASLRRPSGPLLAVSGDGRRRAEPIAAVVAAGGPGDGRHRFPARQPPLAVELDAPLPAAVWLAVFAWLLTLHPTAAGRVYAAYGGVYVTVALLWLRLVDGVPLSGRDLLGSALLLAGMGILMGPGRHG